MRHFTLLALLWGLWGLAHAAEPVVLVVGDSLSAEYGLRRGSGWVALTEEKLRAEKVPARVTPGLLVGVVVTAFLTALAGALYPAWFAARIQPAEALRYE